MIPACAHDRRGWHRWSSAWSHRQQTLRHLKLQRPCLDRTLFRAEALVAFGLALRIRSMRRVPTASLKPWLQTLLRDDPEGALKLALTLGKTAQDVNENDVKSVRMQPDSSLVPASADPTIGVINERLSDQNAVEGIAVQGW